LVDGIELAAPYKHAFAFAKIDGALVEPFEPGMLVPIGKEKEEPASLSRCSNRRAAFASDAG
jgi:hypothetical protein